MNLIRSGNGAPSGEAQPARNNKLNAAARVNLYATTNLTLPLSLWTLLTNAIVPSGSQLRADGFDVTNTSRRFFKAVEAP